MTPEEFTIIDDSGIFAGRQSYTRKVIGRGPDDKKIAVTIHRDFYDMQSTFCAELWDGTKWQRVVAVPGESELGKAMPSSSTWIPADKYPDAQPQHAEQYAARRQQVSTAVDTMVEHLLTQAYAVIY